MSAAWQCQRLAGHQSLAVLSSALPVFRGQSRRCRCRLQSSRGDEQPLPVVSDATVLPPPPTGSQYAWRTSWAGSAPDGGSGGGTGGRSQARTRDWGHGPGSSLFYLMYRIRMLLLYGVWVTVLYGAVHGVCDLAQKFGGGLAVLVGHVAALSGLPGSSDATSSSSSTSSSNSNSAHEGQAHQALSATDALADIASGDGNEGAGSSQLQGGTAAREAAAAGGPLDHEAPQLPGASTRLHDRPTARFFNDLMSVIVPLYLALLGSVWFFSRM